MIKMSTMQIGDCLTAIGDFAMSHGGDLHRVYDGDHFIVYSLYNDRRYIELIHMSGFKVDLNPGIVCGKLHTWFREMP